MSFPRVAQWDRKHGLPTTRDGKVRVGDVLWCEGEEDAIWTGETYLECVAIYEAEGRTRIVAVMDDTMDDGTPFDYSMIFDENGRSIDDGSGCRGHVYIFTSYPKADLNFKRSTPVKMLRAGFENKRADYKKAGLPFPGKGPEACKSCGNPQVMAERLCHLCLPVSRWPLDKPESH